MADRARAVTVAAGAITEPGGAAVPFPAIAFSKGRSSGLDIAEAPRARRGKGPALISHGALRRVASGLVTRRVMEPIGGGTIAVGTIDALATARVGAQGVTRPPTRAAVAGESGRAARRCSAGPASACYGNGGTSRSRVGCPAPTDPPEVKRGCGRTGFLLAVSLGSLRPGVAAPYASLSGF